MAAPGQPPNLGAVVLTGGTAARLGGLDKAALRLDGVSLLERALAALAAAREVVVVGHRVPTSRAVAWTVEDPPRGGPAAGLLAGLERFDAPPDLVAVLAVDMPVVDAGTVARLTEALEAGPGLDGAVLVDPDGRRQPLAAVYRRAALQAVAPAEQARRHGLPVRTLLAGLQLTGVPAVGAEAHDVDTWADWADLTASRRPRLPDASGRDEAGGMSLRDWMDEVCDLLDIDPDVDEALVLDLARDAAHSVARPAAPLTTYLLGFAAARYDADPERLEGLAAAVTALAERWAETAQ